MPRRDTSLRLFIALYPPAEAANQMLGALRRLTLAEHRRTAPEQVHMTLLFLGDTPERDLPHISESIGRSVSGLERFGLSPSRLLTLPQRGPVRLVALETDAPPPLLELVRRLVTRLARHPPDRPADRFLPHVTLCRFRHESRPERLDEPAALEPFVVERIHLIHSTLRPEGAVHEEIEGFDLE